MQHLDEEELVLHYYGESPGEAIQGHLRSCHQCRKLAEEIRRALEAVDDLPLPERDEHYGQQVWQRLQPRLRRRSHWGLGRHWTLAAAVAFLMVAAFLAGRYWVPSTPEMASISAEGRQRILLAAVAEHLEQARLLLVEVANAPAEDDLDISSEQDLAIDLAESNRFYRQAALGSDHAAVADLLDQLERILLDIAHSPPQLPADELEEIQQRIDSDGLLFKLHVVSATVQQQQIEAAQDLARQRL